MRLPENKEASQISHGKIAIAYIKKSFIFDFIATVPLYLIQRYENDPCTINIEGGDYSVILKLVRLVRIKRIFTLLEMNRINKLVETLFAN